MPKRPSAIAVTADSSTIFCGDKFGDVFSLPLLQSPQEDAAFEARARDASTPVDSKAFQPAASELTVHSIRNRQALEMQRKMAVTQSKTKEPLKFAHELLLGHVSMLTDILPASTVDPVSGKRRDYIITADRDEHIRVSRGPPQAYIIERFLLKHRQYVSKLCLVTPEILLSAGGEESVFIWNWATGESLGEIEFWQGKDEEANPPAVSGLWALKLDGPDKVRNGLFEYC
jgi:tRNA (guanine-N(7)-)-methyltransferase subunit TRM82